MAVSSVQQKMPLLSAALAELQASKTALARSQAFLEQAIEEAIQHGIHALPAATAPACEHRRKHRPGKPAKIDSDPELQTFILARLDRMTFTQIADEVRAHFPEARRVGKSAIHAWWQKRASDRPSSFSPQSPDHTG